MGQLEKRLSQKSLAELVEKFHDFFEVIKGVDEEALKKVVFSEHYYPTNMQREVDKLLGQCEIATDDEIKVLDGKFDLDYIILVLGDYINRKQFDTLEFPLPRGGRAMVVRYPGVTEKKSEAFFYDLRVVGRKNADFSAKAHVWIRDSWGQHLIAIGYTENRVPECDDEKGVHLSRPWAPDYYPEDRKEEKLHF